MGNQVILARYPYDVEKVFEDRDWWVCLFVLGEDRERSREYLEGFRDDHPNVPLILVYSEEVRGIVDFLKIGFFDVLSPPVDMVRLKDVISRARMGRRGLTETEAVTNSTSCRIYEVFVLGCGGIMFYHHRNEEISRVDKDIFSGMFTAIRFLIKDSLKGEHELQSMTFSDIWVLIEGDENLNMVVLGRGTIDQVLRDELKKLRIKLMMDHSMALSHNLVSKDLVGEMERGISQIICHVSDRDDGW